MDYISLSILNQWVSESIRQSLNDTYWVVAEISDLRVNPANGHCYLELIERDVDTNSLAAKARAYIWKSVFQVLKPYFEEKTGQPFISGIKVLVKVSVEFHPLYGYGLHIDDIDPVFTMGDLKRQKQEVIRRLKEEGVFDLNQELDLPVLPQRIAVITSPTAAGYEDFLEHLLHNPQGFVFYPILFPALMQGEQTEASIIAALEQIFKVRNFFDVVVIIRGGGASSDLSVFDSYLLASNCAQFPLPIITGIGHERDDSVVDMVAYHRAKTPTAVADYLIDQLMQAFSKLNASRDLIIDRSNRLLNDISTKLQQLTYTLPDKVFTMLSKQTNVLEMQQIKIRHGCRLILSNYEENLNKKESFLKLSSPLYILSRGYSITMKNHKTIKSIQEVQEGDHLETRLADGNIRSCVIMCPTRPMK